jgi:hypothetical protein
MGLQSYKVRCTGSSGPDNDRSEQKILEGWDIADGVRYFSLSLYVPDFAPTPTDFFQMFCQWWQDPDRQPPLQLSWGGDDHLYFARRTEATGWEALHDAGVVRRNHWYHFLFAVDFGLNTTGSVAMYEMDSATGSWVEACHFPQITLGWATKPDGSPAQTHNFTWKVGTYRGSTPLTTRIYYDNIRYGRLWRIVTKNYLTGYHKQVLSLPFEEGWGTTTQDVSEYDNDGELVNGPLWRSQGVQGRCLEFDGVDDHVRVAADPVDFDCGNYLTAMARFKTDVSQSGPAILCMDEYSTTYKFRLYLVSGTSVSFDVRYPDNTIEWMTANLPATVFDDRWHHLAGTFNRWAPDGQRLKLYCDGVLVASSAGQDKPLWRGNNYLYVGKFSGAYFRGFIDEPAVYNYAMTGEEIAAMNPQSAGLESSPALGIPALPQLSVSPNPAPGPAAIAFEIDRPEHIRLAVYDVSGRECARLVDAPRPRGQNHALWDGTDQHGGRVPPGIYFLRLETSRGKATRKFTLIGR